MKQQPHYLPIHRRHVWTCTECGFQNDMSDQYCTGFMCSDLRENEENEDEDPETIARIRRKIRHNLAAYAMIRKIAGFKS